MLKKPVLTDRQQRASALAASGGLASLKSAGLEQTGKLSHYTRTGSEAQADFLPPGRQPGYSGVEHPWKYRGPANMGDAARESYEVANFSNLTASLFNTLPPTRRRT